MDIGYKTKYNQKLLQTLAQILSAIERNAGALLGLFVLIIGRLGIFILMSNVVGKSMFVDFICKCFAKMIFGVHDIKGLTSGYHGKRCNDV